MESHKRLRGGNRTGSLVIEAVISVTLLATATYALTRLARSSAELSLNSDRRLAATLTAENALERLRGLSIDQIPDQTDEIANSLGQSTACNVEISSTPFSLGNRKAMHLQVVVIPSENLRVTVHDWRVESSKNGDESSEANDSATDEETSGTEDNSGTDEENTEVANRGDDND